MIRNGVSSFYRFILLPVIFLMVLTIPAFAVQPGMVQTVLGPVSAEKIGFTLPHEHFVFGFPGALKADETMFPYNREEAMTTCLDEIKKVQQFGIKTIVDATPADMEGRDPQFYKELAQKTGMNIVFSTGFYHEHAGGPEYFRSRMNWFGQDISKMMAELMIKEINDGVGKTGIKPGVIKCATYNASPFSKYETAVLKAAAAASKATNVPIITHVEGPVGGVEQAELFIKEGVNPMMVMIGHVSNSTNINYHRAILAKGTYIAFDRVDIGHITPPYVIAGAVAQLCKEGYANQILLSGDKVNYWMGRPYPEVMKLDVNYRMGFLPDVFIPILKGMGVTDAQIKCMTVDNPKNLFLGKRAPKI